LAFDDLDLEFEDEEEAKKKKNEAVQVDVDLEFSTPDSGASKARPNPTKPSNAPPQAAAPPGPIKPGASRPAPVTNLTDARAARPAAAAAVRPSGMASNKISTTPKVVGNNALQEDQYDVESQQIIEMREHVRKVEFEAEVKIAVAEYKTELLSELLSDTKLMQHQVEQLLVRINAKHPDLKQEVLLIKKILADFNAKKRK